MVSVTSLQLLYFHVRICFLTYSNLSGHNVRWKEFPCVYTKHEANFSFNMSIKSWCKAYLPKVENIQLATLVVPDSPSSWLIIKWGRCGWSWGRLPDRQLAASCHSDRPHTQFFTLAKRVSSIKINPLTAVMNGDIIHRDQKHFEKAGNMFMFAEINSYQNLSFYLPRFIINLHVKNGFSKVYSQLCAHTTAMS